MNRSRALTAALRALTALILLGALLPQPPAAAKPKPRPSADELWRTYPLRTNAPPRAQTRSRAGSAASPSTQGKPARPSAVAARSDGDGSRALLLVATLGLAAVAGVWLVFWLRPPRKAEPEGVPVAAGPARSPQRLPALGAEGGTRHEGVGPIRPGGSGNPGAGRHPPPGPGEQVAEGPLPPQIDVTWTAELEWREHAGSSRFAVVATAAGGDERSTIAESAPLEWPPSGTAAVQALTDAAQALEISLLAAGWQPRPPGSAWYAKRFAWEPAAALEPRDPAPSRFARRAPWPEGTEDLWRCEIELEPGDTHGRFQAVAYSPQARGMRADAEPDAVDTHEAPAGIVLGGSPSFRSLLTALEAAGWQRVGDGLESYGERFVWRRDGAPPERLEPAPAGTGGAA